MKIPMRNEIALSLYQVAALIGLAGLLPVVLIPGWEAFNWLQTGVWYPVPLGPYLLSNQFDAYVTDWAGIQKIILAVLDMPLAGAIFVVAESIAGLLAVMGNAVER